MISPLCVRTCMRVCVNEMNCPTLSLFTIEWTMIMKEPMWHKGTKMSQK